VSGATPGKMEGITVTFRVGILHLILAVSGVSASATPVYPLFVSPDGHHIVDEIGERVYFNGDAPWHLFARLTREETLVYLDDRQHRGFNLLLVALMVSDGYNGSTENAYGEVPFDVPGDFTTPNEAYFAHDDWVIERALERGFTLLIAPAYLGYACGDEGWCAEMRSQGSAAMRDWGRWVGARYAGFPNIIWLNGGDLDAYSEGVMSMVDAVAEGILEYDSDHLQTAHCSRNHSGFDCYDRPWLDFNTTYGNCQTTPGLVRDDYQLVPALPVLYVEGRYEFESGWTANCLRGQAYNALLGGEFGHVFGSGKIWDFPDDWRDGLDSVGSNSMTLFDTFLRTRHRELFLPDYNHLAITAGYGDINTGDYAPAARTPDGNSIVVYLPSPRTVSVDLNLLVGDYADCWWYDPANGSAIFIGNFLSQGTLQFTPPSNSDWVLLVDNQAADLVNPWEMVAVDSDVIPSEVRLFAAAPNPFNPQTRVRFSAPPGARARVRVYDARGKEVAVLFDSMATGALQNVLWHRGDLPSGLYFVRLASCDQVKVQRVPLLR
jgi:hypothetical protein